MKKLLCAAGRLILRLLFRVEVRGMENYRAAGPRAVIMPNHVSLLDPALAALFIPDEPVFAINSLVARWRWVRWAGCCRGSKRGSNPWPAWRASGGSSCGGPT